MYMNTMIPHKYGIIGSDPSPYLSMNSSIYLTSLTGWCSLAEFCYFRTSKAVCAGTVNIALGHIASGMAPQSKPMVPHFDTEDGPFSVEMKLPISCHWVYPLVNVYTKLWKDPPFLFRKFTISTVIFHSYVSLPGSMFLEEILFHPNW